jgi:drug/metabolite transporter (DMT)-like permease
VKRARRLLPLLAAAAVQLVWGFTPSASRFVLDALPVETYAALRYTLAGLGFLAVTLARGGRFAVTRRDLPRVAVLGVLAYALDSLGTLYGLELGGVLNFALASSLNAVITAAVASLVLRERFGRAQVAAAALSVVGGLLLALGKSRASGASVALGSLALIAGAYVLEALGFVFSRTYKARMPLTEYLGIAQLGAGLCLWLVALGRGQSPLAVLSLPPHAALALAFVTLVSCGLCYFVLYRLLDYVAGSTLAFFDCFHTLSAAVFAASLFADPVNAPMLAGGALLFAAVLLVSASHLRRGRQVGAAPKAAGFPNAPAAPRAGDAARPSARTAAGRNDQHGESPAPSASAS